MLALGDRLIALHLFLMFSLMFFGASGNFGAYGTILGIALIKLIVDLASHSREHMIAQAVGMGKSDQSGWNVGPGVIKFFIKTKHK